MQKFVIKSAAGTGFYELDEEKNFLRITIRKNWKTVQKKEFDLQQIDAEFSEYLPVNIRIFPFIMSWCAAVLGILLLLGGMYMIWFDSTDVLIKKLKLTFFTLLAGPMPFFYASFRYIFCVRPREMLGFFCFKKINEADSVFEIPYQLNRRDQAYKLATLIAEYCPKVPKKTQLQKNMKLRFNDIFAEIAENELVFYNTKGVKIDSVRYKDLSDEVLHIVQEHKVRNFFCTTLALLLWLPALFLIFYAVIDTKDWIIISAMLICSTLPGILGLFFWKKRLKKEDVYIIKDRFAPISVIGNNDVYLDASNQDKVQTGEFIEELKKRLKDTCKVNR